MEPPASSPGRGRVQFSHRLLNTAVENPYDAFTAPQFDSWVGDLTSTIRAALNNKSRGKARDPRDGAGLEGLRRELAASRSSDIFDVGANGHEPGESSSFALTPLSDVAHLDDEHAHDLELEQEIERAFEETPYGQVENLQSSTNHSVVDDEHEELDLDAIYTLNGAVVSETHGSPPWEFQEDVVEDEKGDTYTLQEQPDEVSDGGVYQENAEDLIADDDYEESYEEGGVEPYIEDKPVPEIFEIIDDDDEEPVQRPLPGPADDDEEDELDDDDDKENVSVSAFARQLSTPFSAQAPVSSERDRSATPQSLPRSTPLPSPQKPQEIISIDDDDDDLPALPAVATGSDHMGENTGVDLFAFPEDLGHRSTPPPDLGETGAMEVEFQSQPLSDLGTVLSNLATSVEHDFFSGADGPVFSSMLQAATATMEEVEVLLAPTVPDVAHILASFPLQVGHIEEYPSAADANLSGSVDLPTSEGEVETKEEASWLTVEGTEVAANVEPVTEVDSIEVIEPSTPIVVDATEHNELVVDNEQSSSYLSVEDSTLRTSTAVRSRSSSPLFMQSSEAEQATLHGVTLDAEPGKRESPCLDAEISASVDPTHAPPFVSSSEINANDGIESGNHDSASTPTGVSDDEVQKEEKPAHLDVSPETAKLLTTEEKRSLLQRSDIDPFSLMGNDSLVAPGPVSDEDSAPQGEDEDVKGDEITLNDDEHQVPIAPFTSTSLVDDLPTVEDFSHTSNELESSEGVSASVELAPEDKALTSDSDGAGTTTFTSHDGLDVQAIEAEYLHGFETQDAVSSSLGMDSAVQVPDTTHASPDLPAVDENLGPTAQPINPTTTDTPSQENHSTPTQVDVPSQGVDYSALPSAMEDVLGFPSPADSAPSSAHTPTVDDGEGATPPEQSTSRTRKPKAGRPVFATRSSARLARTQSQQSTMSPPKPLPRPPKSAGSEASSVGSSADGSFSRESSVVSSRGRRRKWDDDSAPGSRESTVQPSTGRIKNQYKKRKLETETGEQSTEQSAVAGDSSTARPPLLRTQTYRHFHGKRNGAATESRPKWASLKSLLKPALALLRTKPNDASLPSTSMPSQTVSEPEPPTVAADDLAQFSHSPNHSSLTNFTETATDAPTTSSDKTLADASLSSIQSTGKEEEEVQTMESDNIVVSDEPTVDPSQVSTQAEVQRSAPILAIDTTFEGDTRPSALQTSTMDSPAFPSVPPPTPAVRTASHARRPSFVIQDSFVPESGHMTRSNCRFHKISIPQAPGSNAVVQFLAPACSITNRELMEEEGIVDWGVATDDDHLRTIIELEVVSDEVLHILRLLVGLELLREGEVGFVVPHGESIESLRMPDTSRSIFHQYKKADGSTNGDTSGTTPLKPKKRKRATSEVPSEGSSLTELATDEEDDVGTRGLDSPASRTRSHAPMDLSSPLSPAGSRRRTRSRIEDDEIEYKPTDADRAIEAEDDEEDYDELAPRPKRRVRNRATGSAASSESAPSPAPPVEPQAESVSGDNPLVSGSQSKAQKRAPRRKGRKRKNGVVDPSFKPGTDRPSSDDEAEASEKKHTAGKRGKKRVAGEELPDTTEETTVPAAKKRRTGSVASVV